MSLDGRLSQLTPSLSARERAVLVVRAVNADRAPDPALLAKMPREQGRDYNRLISLARGVQMVLVPRALVLLGEVEALELKHFALTVIAAWGSERTLLAGSAALVAHIPIPQSEHERLLAELRAERLPLDEAAELVAEHHGISERAAATELRRQFPGAASRSGKRARLREVEWGALYDWLGLPLEPVPEWGWRYEPVPNDAYEPERWRRENAERSMVERWKAGPGAPARVLPALGGDHAAPLEELGDLDRTTRALAELVRDGVAARWSQLLAIELVAGEAMAEFDDDGILPEELTALLVDSRERLLRLFEAAPDLVGAIEQGDEDATVVEQLRIDVRTVGRH